MQYHDPQEIMIVTISLVFWVQNKQEKLKKANLDKSKCTQWSRYHSDRCIHLHVSHS